MPPTTSPTRTISPKSLVNRSRWQAAGSFAMSLARIQLTLKRSNHFMVEKRTGGRGEGKKKKQREAAEKLAAADKLFTNLVRV